MLLEPNLLPVALIFPGDGNAFTNGCVDLLEKDLQRLGVQNLFISMRVEQGRELTLHHQIAVAPDRGCGLGIRGKTKAEMRCGSGSHQPATETALDGCKTHGAISKALELSC